MKQWQHILLFSAGLLLLAACGGGSKATTATKPKKSENEHSESYLIKVQRTYIDAEKAKILGDFEEALKLFEQVVALDPDNHAAKYELAGLYMAANLNELALNNIKSAVELNPDNRWYRQMYAEILAQNGDFKSAASVYGEILKDHPGMYDFYFDWAYMLTRAGDYQAAINAYDELEKTIGVEEGLSLQKQKLYLQLNDFDGAAIEIQKLIDAFPNNQKHYNTLAEMYLLHGKEAEAHKIYADLLEVDPNNGYALLAMADFHKQKGEDQAFLEYAVKAFESEELSVDEKIRVLYPYIEYFELDEQDKEEAFILSETLVKAHPDEAKAFAITGDLHYLADKSEEALVYYERSLELQENIYSVWQQVLIIYNELRQFDKLQETATEALVMFPNQPLNYLFKGIAENENKDFDKAIKSYGRGVKMVFDNDGLKAQFYSNMGDTYHAMKLHEQSDSCYELSLSLDEENPFVLNNYSYYLSVRNVKLDKAKKYSMLANTLVPNNPAFQDTYAWILYQLGEYKQAKEWQIKAIENDTENSPVLFEHYGDILFKLGDVDAAVFYWEKALENGGDSELLSRKIADKTLYEE